MGIPPRVPFLQSASLDEHGSPVLRFSFNSGKSHGKRAAKQATAPEVSPPRRPETLDGLGLRALVLRLGLGFRVGFSNLGLRV